jgi:hypothetical protein
MREAHHHSLVTADLVLHGGINSSPINSSEARREMTTFIAQKRFTKSKSQL